MPPRLTRLFGALLLHHGERWFLIGNPKEPGRWADVGFADPGAIDAGAQPILELHPAAAAPRPPDGLALTFPRSAETAEAMAAGIASALLIARNGSVSDRLWRLIFSSTGSPPPAEAELAADWLLALPPHIWKVVCEVVLSCR